jgi:hypothetical protein
MIKTGQIRNVIIECQYILFGDLLILRFIIIRDAGCGNHFRTEPSSHLTLYALRLFIYPFPQD